MLLFAAATTSSMTLTAAAPLMYYGINCPIAAKLLLS